MERDLTLSPSLYGKLSHATNSRPRLPFSSVLQIDRFRGSWRGQSGHLVKGMGPYCGHEEREDEEKLDITRRPENGCRWRRRRTMGCGEGKGKQWHGHGRGAGSTVTWVSCGPGLVLSHAVPFYQPNATRPHTTRPHSSARNGQLNGNPPVRAPSEGFRQGLGQN